MSLNGYVFFLTPNSSEENSHSAIYMSCLVRSKESLFSWTRCGPSFLPWLLFCSWLDISAENWILLLQLFLALYFNFIPSKHIKRKTCSKWSAKKYYCACIDIHWTALRCCMTTSPSMHIPYSISVSILFVMMSSDVKFLFNTFNRKEDLFWQDRRRDANKEKTQ